MGTQSVEVRLKRHDVALDPYITVFSVATEKDGVVHSSSWGTEGELSAFLQGVVSVCRLLDVPVTVPSIPAVGSSRFVREIPKAKGR